MNFFGRFVFSSICRPSRPLPRPDRTKHRSPSCRKAPTHDHLGPARLRAHRPDPHEGTDPVGAAAGSEAEAPLAAVRARRAGGPLRAAHPHRADAHRHLDLVRPAHQVLHRELGCRALRRAAQLLGRHRLRPGHRQGRPQLVPDHVRVHRPGGRALVDVRHGRRGRAAEALQGSRPVPHAVPGALRAADVRRHHHVEVHVPADF